MKKSFLIIMFTILTSFLLACQSNDLSTTTEELSTTEEISSKQNTTTEIDAVFPSYDEYNEEWFTYAEVRIFFSYDYPSELTQREEKRAYFEEKNQEYFEYSGLEDGLFDNAYMSSYSSYIGLTYKSKLNLLKDFDLLKQGLNAGYYGPPEVYLKTVGTYYTLDVSSTLESMIEVTDQYFGTEITHDSIPFNMLANESSMSVSQNKVYETYENYIFDYPNNEYEISSTLFETQVLIIVSFGHSGSLTIEGIDSVFYLDEDTLEVAIKSSASSIIMTEDYNPRTIVLSIAKEDFVSDVAIRIHFHTFFKNGTYADRPYHNSVDQKRTNE